jgi:hypothetical protein
MEPQALTPGQWQFICKSCGQTTIEDDANEGVASCENSACRMYGKTVLTGSLAKDEPESQAPEVSVTRSGGKISITVNINL